MKHKKNMSVEHSTINQTAINEQEKRHLLVSSYVGNRRKVLEIDK